MTVTSTIYDKYVAGNKRIRVASFTRSNTATSAETIETGLKRVTYFDLGITGSGTASASTHVLRSNTTNPYPLKTGSVVVYFDGTTAGTVTGIWKAEGY